MPLLQKSSVPIMAGRINGAPIMAGSINDTPIKDGSIGALTSQLPQQKLSGVLFEAQTTEQVD